MSVPQEIRVGDTGVKFQLTLTDPSGNVMDVSLANSVTLLLEQPFNLGVKSFTMTNVTDGKDGQVAYVTQTGDIAVAGNWRMQVKAQMPSGTIHSDVETFKVLKNLA